MYICIIEYILIVIIIIIIIIIIIMLFACSKKIPLANMGVALIFAVDLKILESIPKR